jgi:hypothetical protein
MPPQHRGFLLPKTPWLNLTTNFTQKPANPRPSSLLEFGYNKPQKFNIDQVQPGFRIVFLDL